jgi:predicted amidophosphoribosyltransferase
VLLVSPGNTTGQAICFNRSCPVCNKRLIGSPNYCSECGSKV